jgi:hypothetical protein
MPTYPATKSLDDAVNEIRMLINDLDLLAPRFTQTQVLDKLNTALLEVYRYRPDAYVGNFQQGILSQNQPTTYTAADLGQVPLTPWPLDIRLFFTPVIMYVVGLLDLTDDEFADDNRAMTVITAFRNMLIGPGG